MLVQFNSLNVEISKLKLELLLPESRRHDVQARRECLFLNYGEDVGCSI